MSEFLEESFALAPFLLVVDRSKSMAGGPITEINEGLPKLVHTLKREPYAAEAACLGMISFADNAQEHFAMSKIETAPRPSELTAGGQTNYGAAFELAKHVLARDVPNLGARGYRPVLLFLTDGQPFPPERTWRPALHDLCDLKFPWRPKIVTFGFGEADHDVLLEVASHKDLAKTWDGVDPAAAVRSILGIVLRTVITLSEGAPQASQAASDDLAAAVLAYSDTDAEAGDQVIEYVRR